MSITISQITRADIDSFHAALDDVARESGFLARDSAPPIDSTRDFVGNNIDQNHVQLVAKVGDRVVGWCDVLPRDADGVGTVGMGVVKDYRGQGLGARLLREALAAAATKNFSHIRLDVQQRNTGAIALYKKIGFEIMREYRREDGHGRPLYDMIWKGAT